MNKLDVDASPLTVLWQTVGLPADEATAAMAALHDALRALVAQKLADETAGFEAMRAECPALQAELTDLTDVLGADAVSVARQEAIKDDAPLVPKRRALFESAEAARQTRDKRAERRTSMEARIAQVRTDLDGDDETAREAAKRRASSPAYPEANAAGGLTEALLGRLQRRLDEANDEHAERASAVDAAHARADEHRKVLGYPAVAFEGSDRPISLAALAAAEQALAELEAEKTRRTTVLSDCLEYISELRAKLELPQAEWTALPDPATEGLTQDVLEVFFAELNRLDLLKAQGLGPLLANARARLRPLWKELHMSEAETRAFAPAWASDDAEAVDVGALAEGAEVDVVEALETALEEVEGEERRLKAKLEACGKVLGLMMRREQLLAEHAEMVEASKDPNRLKARNAAQLLKKEEMVRAAYKNKLPKMTKDLREMAEAYEREEGNSTLTFDGVSILHALDSQEDGDKKAKAKEIAEIAAKKEAKDAEKKAAAHPKAAPPKKAGVSAAHKHLAASKLPKGPTAKAPAAPSGAPPVPPPPSCPPPATPAMPTERVPGEDLAPVHAVPSPAVLQALNSLPTPASPSMHNAFETPAAPMKGKQLLAEATDQKENPVAAA